MKKTGIVTWVSRNKEITDGWGYNKVTVEGFFCGVDVSGEEVKLKVILSPTVTKPWIGDTISFDAPIRSGWGKITEDRYFEITEANVGARDNWRQEKALEREKKKQEWQEQIKCHKAEVEADIAERRRVLEERLPDEVVDTFTKSFNAEKLLECLRWFYTAGKTGMGEGGEIDYTGHGGGHPGTGLRAPGAPFYELPGASRTHLKLKLQQIGVVTGDDDGYRITNKGVHFLEQMDICSDCGERRWPYLVTSQYHRPGSSVVMHGVRFRYMCVEERRSIGTPGYSGCNYSNDISPGPYIPTHPSAVGMHVCPKCDVRYNDDGDHGLCQTCWYVGATTTNECPEDV